MLYAPIVIIAIFSFTESKVLGNWTGFSTELYASLFSGGVNNSLIDAIKNTFIIAMINVFFMASMSELFTPPENSDAYNSVENPVQLPSTFDSVNENIAMITIGA